MRSSSSTLARSLVGAAGLLAMGCAREAPPPAAPNGAASVIATAPARTRAPKPSEPENASIGPEETGVASYYSNRLAGRKTANGERYDPSALTAAHRTLPFGTWVEVRRGDGRKVAVRINDRGPYARGRIIDLSYRAASELGILHDGVARVVLRRLREAASR